LIPKPGNRVSAKIKRDYDGANGPNVRAVTRLRQLLVAAMTAIQKDRLFKAPIKERARYGRSLSPHRRRQGKPVKTLRQDLASRFGIKIWRQSVRDESTRRP
jgi:hypothetical protein